MKSRHKDFAVKFLRGIYDVFDFGAPILGYTADRLEKRSGSQHKKAYKKATDKYLKNRDDLDE